MRPVLVLLLMAAVLAVLASIAVGIILSTGAGPVRWVLMAAFALDSGAVLVLAAHATRRTGPTRR